MAKHFASASVLSLTDTRLRSQDEYIKVMYEKSLPRRLPKVCVKVPGGEVEVEVEGTFENPEVKDVWAEILKEREERDRHLRQQAPGPLNRLDGSREVTTFIDVDDMKDESKVRRVGRVVE